VRRPAPADHHLTWRLEGLAVSTYPLHPPTISPLVTAVGHGHATLFRANGATPVTRPPTSAPADATSFWTRDGVRLALTRRSRPDRDGQRRRRAVVLVPGLFTSRDCPEHQTLAEQIAEVADVVSVDVRGHGESGGVFSWGLREPGDLAGLVRSLRVHYDRVDGVGFSFGGYHVGAAAAAHRSFDAVAMIASPRSFSILDRHFLLRGLRRSFGAARRRQGYARRFSFAALCRRRIPANQFVGAIAPAPLLIAHGTQDWLLSTDHATDLYDRAAHPKSLVLVDGAPHAEGMMVEHASRLVPPLLAFLA
jgi:pimeloyl-ACP methyl ester carboxylesterase